MHPKNIHLRDLLQKLMNSKKIKIKIKSLTRSSCDFLPFFSKWECSYHLYFSNEKSEETNNLIPRKHTTKELTRWCDYTKENKGQERKYFKPFYLFKMFQSFIQIVFDII